MFQTVSEVVKSECVVKWDTGDSVKQTCDISEVELLYVP